MTQWHMNSKTKLLFGSTVLEPSKENWGSQPPSNRKKEMRFQYSYFHVSTKRQNFILIVICHVMNLIFMFYSTLVICILISFNSVTVCWSERVSGYDWKIKMVYPLKHLSIFIRKKNWKSHFLFDNGSS